MLIKCPECDKEVSDKAISCPCCGYPMNLPTVAKKPSYNVSRTIKYRRLPNGFGSIKKLSGKRRKPYAAFPPIKNYHDNGSPIYEPAIGFFESYNDAYACLIEYNKHPFDTKRTKILFSELYKQYYDDKYSNPNRKYSDASKNSTKCAYENLSNLHNRNYADLKTIDMQREIDKCKLKHSSLELMVSLLKSMGKYALQHDVISKDYAQFVRINIADDDEKGVPFNDKEMEILWKNSEDKTIQTLLIMIYTGLRISELNVVEVHKEERWMQGGVKTRAGKDRIIPIHKAILPFVDNIKVKSTISYRERLNSRLVKLGIDVSDKGTHHTPHDARHTFSMLADQYGIPSFDKHLIMGHSLGTNDVEQTVYGHRTTQQLIDDIDMIKVPYCY